MPIDIPRDRHGTFEPQLIPKHQTRWTGFDDKILSLYARGMTVREIQSHLEEMYGAEVSPTLISSVSDAVIEEVKTWRARPLDALYPIVYLDCIHVKVRDGSVRVKAVYLAIGINMNGEKEVLGLWIAQTEGAKFWLQVVTELKNRGVQDIFIACVDGLKGFPEAIESVNMSLRKITKNRGSFPKRRGIDETVLSRAQEHPPEMDHANPKLESGTNSIYYPVRRPNGRTLTQTPFTQNSGHPRMVSLRPTSFKL